MNPHCTIQIHIDGAWRDAAALDLMGERAHGVQAATFLAYLPDYILEYYKRNDAAALSASLPVDLAAQSGQSWPPAMVDLLPQGYGRAELLKQLERDQDAGPAADWDLLCAGAGNPIGNARILEAHQWVMQRAGQVNRGFTVHEVAARAADFNEYLAQHGLFLAGSSGVQGEWPKILLTQARDGLFYLDHALPDDQAVQHFIVKFGRGPDQRLADILRLEAPYMQLAKHLQLHVHADLFRHERALFIPRFDRQVHQSGVLRHGQESIASLCGRAGFGARISHNEVCRALGKVCTNPEADIIEYLKRDIANVALGNKDNHARNTAIVRRADGFIGLTPLFDFAPMWLHPDGIARQGRWEHDDQGAPIWSSAIQQACVEAGVDVAVVAREIKQMLGPIRTVLTVASELNIDEEFIAPLRPAIANIRAQLEDLDG
jgi:serine/threonine-protein kinase HipA